MQLSRCKDQTSATLDGFYAEIAANDGTVDQRIGKTMLALIGRLRALPDVWQVWGLTSHYHLLLLAEDTYKSPSFVRVMALDAANYSIDYLMPENLAPWPGAHVNGEARSEDEAIRMILIAMENSGGWT